MLPDEDCEDELGLLLRLGVELAGDEGLREGCGLGCFLSVELRCLLWCRWWCRSLGADPAAASLTAPSSITSTDPTCRAAGEGE